MKTKILAILFGLLTMHLSYGQNPFSKTGIKKGSIRVKFDKNQQNTLEKHAKSIMQIRADNPKFDGVIPTGITRFDAICKKSGAIKMKRVFRHGGKHEAKHQEYGLHLWYEVEFNTNIDLKVLMQKFSALSEISTTSYIRRASLLDKPNVNKKEINNKTFTPNDPKYSDQWHYNNTGQNGGTPGADINLPDAWDLVTGNSNVVVAITDLGIDYNHEDLKNNMWTNDDEIPGNNIDDDNNGYVDDYYGYNFNQDKGEISPGEHGTHVAGTVAAETNNGIGVSGIAGGTGKGDGVRLMSCQILVSNSGEVDADAFIYAADNGAVISQNSWGFNSSNFPAEFKDAIDYFTDKAGGNGTAMQGGLVIFASGNDNKDGDYYPGKYERCMAVSALDKDNKKASYSNFGSWVDLSAPGSDVLSTMLNNKYGTMSGTSMACPHVSGVAALVLSRAYGILTNEELRELLTLATDPLDESGLGTGAINALKAVSTASNEPPPAPQNLKTSVVEPARITLVWDKVNTAVYYNLQIRKINGNWITYEKLLSNTITVKTDATTQYEIRIKAENFAGESEYTTPIKATTPDWPALSSTPKNITAPVLRFNFIKFTWDHVYGSKEYDVQFRENGKDWNTTTGIEDNEFETEASQLTNYEFRVKAKNPISDTAYSAIISVMTPDIPYCDPSGGNTAFSHTKLVQLESINNTSGSDGGYGDYTHLSTDLQKGNTYTINVATGGTFGFSKNRFRAWIDFNQDGVFADDEIILEGITNGSSPLSQTFSVPTNVKNGIAGLRVSHIYGGFKYPDSCAPPFFGEVEDYKVHIKGNGVLLVDNENTQIPTDNGDDLLSVVNFPNPAHNMFKAEINIPEKGSYTIKLINNMGNVITKNQINTDKGILLKEFDTSNLPQGLYHLIITDSKNKSIIKQVMVF
ncbi:putative secreted protein (Por secretion system target) [Aquimarina sp. MAR_2010_214]|uniref:S8 family serine peptidase n=1 Tax=Aquimarina sp. MAR_2010_214 TaxID=1250026 RepID=UPI000C70C348|nr:S8 family serine peptidase [Aquimarina sp. MAR_2010_214]PKV50379.1 putative secreted protein (Por secretion system target) [Aquimarina sp. MAR_2010_214]